MLETYKQRFFWAISGILLGFSFPISLEIPSGILAWFALVPMLLSMRKVETFKAYFLCTFPIMFVSTYILGAFVFSFSLTVGFVTCFSQTILAYLPLIVHYFFQKKIGWHKSLILLPLVWTICDWLQHLVAFSFQVSSLAYTQTTVLRFAQCADIFGMWGITFWIVSINVAITLAMNHFQHQETWKNEVLKAIAIFSLPLLYNIFSSSQKPNEHTIKVALVQTNENSLELQDSLELNKNLNHLLLLVDSAAASKPDLIVLPESAFKFPLMQHQENFDAIRSYILKWNTSLAVGFPDFSGVAQPNMCYNAAFVFTPSLAYYWDSLGMKTAELKVYHKQNPLPVSETIPFGDFLGIKGKILPIGGYETLSGNEPYAFSFPDKKNKEVKTAVTICWEQFFPETQAALAANGAQFFTQMNNDGWFGNSSGAAQLLNMNRLRAIENRRAIARCSNTGFSGFIDQNGKFYDYLPTQTESVKLGTITLNNEVTFFSKYGNWFPKFLLALVIFLVVTYSFKL